MSASGSKPKESVTILVVDDEQGIRDLLSSEFSRLGYKVQTASNGLDALNKLKLEPFNLVISDIKMPKMDGLEMLQNVKKFYPDIEVIITTGYGTIETAVEAMKHGAYDYIQKPFNILEITLLVEKALEKAELRAMVTLYETSQAIHSALRIEILLPSLVNLSMKLLKADDISIMLMDENEKLRVAAAVGLDDSVKKNVRLALGERIAGKVAQNREFAIVSGPLENDERFKDLEGRQGIQSSLIYPLLSKTKVLGVLCAARTNNPVPFSQEDVRYANIFISQISQAIENAHLYTELEQKMKALGTAYSRLSEMQQELIQMEKLAGIGEMASGVAHELNNPLTTVIGLTDMLLTEKRPNEETEDLRTIKEQATRCSKIITNLLQFARKHEPEKKAFIVAEAVEKTLQLMEYELKCSGIQIEKNYEDKNATVEADFYQVQQVLINIISNARHALKDAPHPTLKVQVQSIEAMVRIRVEDNGSGIAPQHLSKIFDPFFTTKEVGKGTGLGLSISYGIIKNNGGEIRVESQLEHGTAFTIELPLH